MARLKNTDVRVVLNKLAGGTPTNVSGATAAAPPVITATAHGLTTGDAVVVYDAGGVTAGVNGFWPSITVINANSFSIDGSTGVGTYTSGGKVSRISSQIKPADVENLSETLDRLPFRRGNGESTVQALLESNTNL